jgi:2,3-bisphosphoglycerate-dependent phosphoglycerate mutase
MLPYFAEKILPAVKAGKTVLVSARGNSLRSLVMHLDRLSKEEVLELNLATGVPIIYDIDAEGKVQGKQIL